MKRKRQKISYEDEMNDAFYKVFYSVQYCIWYVLYGPEYENDFSDDSLKEFTRKMNENNNKLCEEEICKVEKENLIRNYNFDCSAYAKQIPYAVRVKMVGRQPTQSIAGFVMKSMFRGVEEAIFLAAYTLIHNYAYDEEKLKKCMNDLTSFASMYKEGFTDEHLFKYFEEVQGIKVNR